MKKLITIIVVLLLLSCSTKKSDKSEPQKVETEEVNTFTSFLDIPFGTEKEEVYKSMTDKGWKLEPDWIMENGFVVPTEKNWIDTNRLSFYGTQYAGKDVLLVDMSFSHNKLNYVTVFFKDSENVSKIQDAFVKKYGLVEGGLSYQTKDGNFWFDFDDDTIGIIDTRDYGSTIDSDI